MFRDRMRERTNVKERRMYVQDVRYERSVRDVRHTATYVVCVQDRERDPLTGEAPRIEVADRDVDDGCGRWAEVRNVRQTRGKSAVVELRGEDGMRRPDPIRSTSQKCK